MYLIRARPILILFFKNSILLNISVTVGGNPRLYSGLQKNIP